MSRRRVIDPRQPPPAVACLACGVPFGELRADRLRPVHFAWRCKPGHEPRTFELRCSACGHRAIVVELPTGGLVFVPEQATSIATVRDSARADAAERFDDDD